MLKDNLLGGKQKNRCSRLDAYQRSGKNIDELLENLNREFHSLRQGCIGIDEEMFDVISGFEALEGSRGSSSTGIIPF